MIDGVKLAQCQLDTSYPHFKRLIDSRIRFLGNAWLDLLTINIDLEFFSVAVIKIHFTGNRTSEASSTDAKHFRTLHATIVYYCDIGRTATNVSKDSREVTASISTKDRATDNKWLGRNSN
ncbi:hypothetical protein D3C85_1089300 [compost metagenome]